MVFLREITRNDIALINKWRNNDKLIDYLGSPFRYINIETDEAWFQNYMSNRNNQVRCAICVENNNEPIGVTYLLNIDYQSRNAEFSIMIGSQDQRNKGYGYQATKKMLEYAFFQNNMHRVTLYVLERNKRAIHLYKKIGFEQEGIMKEAIFKNNKYENVLIMGLLKANFEKLHVGEMGI